MIESTKTFYTLHKFKENIIYNTENPAIIETQQIRRETCETGKRAGQIQQQDMKNSQLPRKI